MACRTRGAEDPLGCRSLGCRSPLCTKCIKQDSSPQTEKHTKERGLRGRLLVGSHNHQKSWRTTLGRWTGAARSLSSLWPQSKAYSEWDLLLGTVGPGFVSCPLSDYGHGCCPWKTLPRATAHLPWESCPHVFLRSTWLYVWGRVSKPGLRSAPPTDLYAIPSTFSVSSENSLSSLCYHRMPKSESFLSNRNLIVLEGDFVGGKDLVFCFNFVFQDAVQACLELDI